jgi:hypothetical protein
MATKTKEKDISFKASQTSSAATRYGGADTDWLKKIPGVANWIKLPQVDLGKILVDIKGILARLTGGNFAKEIGAAILGNLKELFGQGLKSAKTEINSILSVGNKIIGQITTTAEGQGMAIFGTLSAALLGGATLLGAGPEVITGMLRGVGYVWSLNLNETDAEIDKQLEGDIAALYGVAGQTFGAGVASFVTGGVFRIPKVQINITKVTILWRALNEEARSQLLSQLRNLARTAFFTGVRMITKLFYRSTRKWIKALAKKDPNHPLIKLIPGGAKSVAQWGMGGKPWAMRTGWQTGVEKLQANPLYKNIGVFLENFGEAFGESLQEFLPELVRQPVS